MQDQASQQESLIINNSTNKNKKRMIAQGHHGFMG